MVLKREDLPKGMEFAGAAAGRLCDLVQDVARVLNVDGDVHVCMDEGNALQHMDKRIVDFIQKATTRLIGETELRKAPTFMPAITAPDAPKAKRKAKKK